MPINERIEEAANAATNLVTAAVEVSNFLSSGTSDSSEARHPFIASVVSTLAAYAWNGAACAKESLEEGLAELSTAVELLRGNFMLPDGTDCLAKSSREVIQRLANAADARWQLDQGHRVRVDQLSALAGVAEKTVRAATNPKGANPLPVSKNGYWSFIEAEDALAWLGRRNDFKPTHQQLDGVEQPLISDESILANVCRDARAHSGQTVEQLGAKLKWSDAQLRAYRGIESQAPGDVIADFPPQALQELARQLLLPAPPVFARQAYIVLALAHASSLSSQLTTASI